MMKELLELVIFNLIYAYFKDEVNYILSYKTKSYIVEKSMGDFNCVSVTLEGFFFRFTI